MKVACNNLLAEVKVGYVDIEFVREILDHAAHFEFPRRDHEFTTLANTYGVT